MSVVMWGCSHKPAPGESIAEVCVVANHRKTVTVSGYVVPPMITLGCENSCSVYISAESGVTSGVWATFAVGEGKSQMRGIKPIKDGFAGEVRRLSARDYRILGDNGRVANAGDVVRVTGELWFTGGTGATDCSLRVKSVEVP
ncbi:MAG: hypothetical protein QM817_16485 [Archangium sp.]